MAVPTENMDFRSSILTFVLLGYKDKAIHEFLVQAYKEGAPCASMVRKWARRFRSGRTTTAVHRSGRPSSTEGLADAIMEQLDEQPFSSLRTLALDLGYSRETIRLCLNNKIGFRWFMLRWVPHTLSEQQKQQRVQVSRQMLIQLRNRRQGDIITVDESWFHYHYTNRGRWAASATDVDERTKPTLSSQKSMVTVMWGVRGFPVIDVLPDGQTFNAEYAASLLDKLDMELRKTRLVMGSSKMTLHWDNARPHKSALATATIRRLKMSQLPHPPYSPDLAPSDFYLFGEIKRRLAGKNIMNPDQLLDAIQAVTKDISKETLEKVYSEWIERLVAVSESHGDYLID